MVASLRSNPGSTTHELCDPGLATFLSETQFFLTDKMELITVASHGVAVAQSWHMESAPWMMAVTVKYSSSRSMNQGGMGSQGGRRGGKPCPPPH